jgi:hypothetical protein
VWEPVESNHRAELFPAFSSKELLEKQPVLLMGIAYLCFF